MLFLRVEKMQAMAFALDSDYYIKYRPINTGVLCRHTYPIVIYTLHLQSQSATSKHFKP